jgi:hypothetical protein
MIAHSLLIETRQKAPRKAFIYYSIAGNCGNYFYLFLLGVQRDCYFYQRYAFLKAFYFSYLQLFGKNKNEFKLELKANITIPDIVQFNSFC